MDRRTGQRREEVAWRGVLGAQRHTGDVNVRGGVTIGCHHAGMAGQCGQ